MIPAATRKMVYEEKKIPLIPHTMLPHKVIYNENYLRLSIVFDRGGTDLLAQLQNPRGYYLICEPIRYDERTNLISQVVGRGKKILLLAVARKSPKRELQAAELAVEKEAELIQAVCETYGYTLAEGVADCGNG